MRANAVLKMKMKKPPHVARRCLFYVRAELQINTRISGILLFTYLRISFIAACAFFYFEASKRDVARFTIAEGSRGRKPGGRH